MIVHLACPNCGDVGRESAEAVGGVVSCPRCEAAFRLEPIVAAAEPSSDDRIASWLEPLETTSRPAARDPSSCPLCGGEGTLGMGCPACGLIRQKPLVPERFEVECPECGALIQTKPGRTEVCPACRSFLGILVPEAPRRRWWRRGRPSTPGRP